MTNKTEHLLYSRDSAKHHYVINTAGMKHIPVRLSILNKEIVDQRNISHRGRAQVKGLILDFVFKLISLDQGV